MGDEDGGAFIKMLGAYMFENCPPKEASGKRPDKRQLPALIAENARLTKELEYSHKDQSGLFAELQKSQKENATLKADADALRTLQTHAPKELQAAISEASRRKQNYRPSPRSSSPWTK